LLGLLHDVESEIHPDCDDDGICTHTICNDYDVKMVLVPGYCTIVPRNLSVIFHRWMGFQWAISEGRD